jgi:hypothetical protein
MWALTLQRGYVGVDAAASGYDANVPKTYGANLIETHVVDHLGLSPLFEGGGSMGDRLHHGRDDDLKANLPHKKC